MRTNELPPVLLDMVEIDGISRERVTMPRSIDAPPAELERLIVRQVPMISLVEDTVCEGATRTNREEVSLEPCTVGVDIEDSRTLPTNVRQYHAIHYVSMRGGRTVLSQPQIMVP